MLVNMDLDVFDVVCSGDHCGLKSAIRAREHLDRTEHQSRPKSYGICQLFAFPPLRQSTNKKKDTCLAENAVALTYALVQKITQRTTQC